MKNIFNKTMLILLIFISPSIAADKYKINPYTSRLDNTGPFTAGTLTGGSYCTYDAGTDSIICTSAGSGSTLPGGGQNAVQRNNGGTFTGDETQFSSNGTNVGIGTTNGNALFSINSTANQSLFRIDDNGINDASPAIYVKADGNVGIGTTNPMTNFQVGGGGVPAGAEIEILSAAPELGLTETDTSKFWEIWVNSSTLRFSDSSDRMVIEGTNGNVGINTAIPPNKLYIAGTIEGNGFKLNGQNGAAGSVLVSDSTGIGTWMPSTTLPTEIVLTTTGTSGASTLTGNALNIPQYSGGSSNWFTQNEALGNVGTGTYNRVGIGTFFGNGSLVVLPGNNSGNVGIGTWNPVESLQTKGKIAILGGGAAGTPDIYSTTAGSTTGIYFPTTNQIAMSVAGASAIHVDNNKNVGINNASPANTLDVLSVNSPVVAKFKSSGGDGGISVVDATGDEWRHFVNNNDASLWMYGNSALRMSINSSGNVGIGSTAATVPNKLYVNGTAEMSGVKINSQGGSGYVLVSGSTGIGTWMAGSTLPAGTETNTLTTATTGIADDQVPVGSSADVAAYKTIPACTDSGGNHLNYDQSSNAFSCGTTSSSGGSSQWKTTVGIGTVDAVAIGTYTTASKLTVAGNVGIATNASSYYASVAAPTGSLFVEKNIGIGTWEPTGSFQLFGNGAAGSSVLVSNAVGVGTWMASTTLNVTATATPGGSSPQLQYNNAGAMGGITSGGTNGTNIGIGTVSFVNALNVVGNIGIGTVPYNSYVTSGSGNSGLRVEGGVGIGTSTFPNGDLILMSGKKIGIGTVSPTDAIVVMNGNVGIGSVQPHNLLTISNGTNTWSISNSTISSNINGTSTISNTGTTASAVLNVIGSNAVSGGLILSTSSSVSAAGADYILFKGNASGATNLVTIRGNGNMGLGTTAPYSRLQVIGNIGIGTGQSSSFQGTVPPNGGMIVETNIGIGTVNPGTSLDVNGVLRISNAGDTYLQGNVGLGTAIPMNTLSVLGNVGIGSTKYGGNVCVGGQEVGNSGGLCVSTNVGIGTLIPTAALQIFSGTANVGIGTYTSGTALCWKNCHATTGRCELGYATGTLTGNIWSGCN